MAHAKASSSPRNLRGGPTSVDGRGTVQASSGLGGPSVQASKPSAHSQPPRPRPTPRGEAGQRHRAMAAEAYASPMPAAPSGPPPQHRPPRRRSLSERQKLPVPTESERNRQRTLMEFYRQKVTAPAEAAALLGSPCSRAAKPLTTVAVGSRALRQTEHGHQKSTPRGKPLQARSRRETSASPSRHRAAHAESLTAHSSKESLGVMVAAPEYRSRSEGPVKSVGSAASTAPSSPGGSPRATEHRGAAALMLTYARPSLNAELKLPSISASAAFEAAAAEAATAGRRQQQQQSPDPRRREKELRPAMGAPLSPLGASTSLRAQAGASAGTGLSEAVLCRAKEVQSAIAYAAATPVATKKLTALHARIGIDGLLPKLEHSGEGGQTVIQTTEQTPASEIADVCGTEVASAPLPPAAAPAPQPPSGPSPAAQSFNRRQPPPPACFGGAGKASSIGSLLGEIDARREMESLGLKRTVVPCS